MKQSNIPDIDILPNDFTNIGRFSDRGILTDDPSFQIDSMNHKITKINRKKTKKMENYKNIEILKNIHDDDENVNNDIPIGGNSVKKPIIEGYKLMTTTGVGEFRHEEFTGYDDVIDGGSGKIVDPRQILINMINFVYYKMKEIEYFFAYEITQILSGGEANNNHIDKSKILSDGESNSPKNDVDVVQYYIAWFLSIFVSCFVVFNWFYLIFYRDLDTGDKIITTKFDDAALDKIADQYFLVRLLLPILKYSVWYINTLDNFLTNTLYIGLSFLNPTMLFICLFYILVYIFFNFTDWFKNSIIDIINVNWNNPIIIAFYVITGFLVLIDELSFTWNYKDFIVKLPAPYITLPIYVILLLVFAIICVLITPLLAGFFCTFYLIFYSLFSVTFYSNFDAEKTKNTYKKILQYASNTKNVKKETFCDKLTMWEKFISNLNFAFDLFYKYVFQSAYIFMLLWGIIDYMYNIKSVTLKSSLMVINMSLIIIICIFSVMDYVEKEDEEVCLAETTAKKSTAKEAAKSKATVVEKQQSITPEVVTKPELVEEPQVITKEVVRKPEVVENPQAIASEAIEPEQVILELPASVSPETLAKPVVASEQVILELPESENVTQK